VNLILDTSCWISLFRGGLLRKLLNSKHKFLITDWMAEAEIITQGLRSFIDLNGIEKISTESKDYINEVKRIRKKTKEKASLQDCHGVYCAKVYSYLLVSNDFDILGELAEEEGIECRDLLWLLDQMLDDENIITTKEYIDAIDNILIDTRFGQLRKLLIQKKTDLGNRKKKGD